MLLEHPRNSLYCFRGLWAITHGDFRTEPTIVTLVNRHNLMVVPTDKCILQSSSGKPLSTLNGDHPRQLQLDTMQTLTDCGELSPSGYFYITALHLWCRGHCGKMGGSTGGMLVKSRIPGVTKSVE